VAKASSSSSSWSSSSASDESPPPPRSLEEQDEEEEEVESLEGARLLPTSFFFIGLECPTTGVLGASCCCSLALVETVVLEASPLTLP
jgi:hypothetical protein